mgnify:CR=1 FL=1
MRELTRALRADKPTEKVETRGIEGNKKRWTRAIEEHETRGIKKRWTRTVEERNPGPDEERQQGVETQGRVRCRLKKNLKLSLRALAGLAAQAENWTGVNQKVIGQISCEGIYLGVSVGAHLLALKYASVLLSIRKDLYKSAL